jgi:division protein 1
MTTRMINSAASSVSAQSSSASNGRVRSSGKILDFATLGRAPGRLSHANRRVTSHQLEILEATSELTSSPIPPESEDEFSLIRGFNATAPSSERGKTRRRKTRHVETGPLGLKEMGSKARGLLTDSATETNENGLPVANSRALRSRSSLSANVRLGRPELERQKEEIRVDQEHIAVRRVRDPLTISSL